MISQLRNNSVGAWWKAQVNQLISLTKDHAKVSMLCSLKWMFWRHCEEWLGTLFYSFSAMLPLRETRLIKIWHGKKVMLHLIYFYADQFDYWLSLGSGEFEPCLVEVGNSNCVKSFQWNTSFVFQYGGLKVNSSWANGLGWTSQGWGSKCGQWVESHNCCWFCFLPKYWPSNLALM